MKMGLLIVVQWSEICHRINAQSNYEEQEKYAKQRACIANDYDIQQKIEIVVEEIWYYLR
jgi:hypothetical protein